jgi:hypothetical protein
MPTINLGPQRKQVQGASSKKYAKFYNNSRWRKLRAAKVHAFPLCERCLAKTPSVVREVDEVHHRTPFDPENPDYDLIYNFDNLISLCYTCHREEQTPLRRAKNPNSKWARLKDLEERGKVVKERSDTK